MRSIYALVTLILVLISSSVSAQNKVNGSIKGKLADTVFKETLAEATVTVLDAKDSSVIGFALANARGEFEVKDLPAGMYRLLITFQGYDPFSKNFMISPEFQNVNLNTIYLEKKGTTLQSVTVEAAPITVKKDTVEFRASAFKTKPNSTAEDLLKKVPGMQVDKDGNVKAQGEDIQKVYVDGKEFFGTDPKLATKNITADMIESIQVFDDMSDQAKFTRIDDGSRAKTINIKLKKDKRKGYFGRFAIGGGTDDRYESTLSFNKFNGDQRISIVGGSNNINRSTFNFSDIVTNMGGGANRGGGGGGGMQISGGNFGGGGNRGGGGGFGGFGGFGGGSNGITRATSIGINYADKWGSKMDITGSYFFSQSKNMNERNAVRKTTWETDAGDSIPEQTTDSRSEALNQNHRFNLRAEFFIDSMNSILYTPSLTFQHSETLSSDTTFTRSANPKTGVGFLAQTGVNNNSNHRDGFNLNNNLLYRHRFGKTGRTFTLGWFNSINNSDAEGQNRSRQLFLNEDGTINRTINQDYKNTQETRSRSNNITSSYTEPIGKNKILEFNYAYQNRHTTSDREAFDFDNSTGKYDSLNLLQTNYFENDVIMHRGGANFLFQNAKTRFQFGGAVESNELTSRSIRAVTGKDTTVTQNFLNFAPTANFQYTFSRTKNLRINYRGRTNQPNINQLQDIVDESNPLELVAGNPSLGQEFNNNLNFNYSSFNVATFKFFNANLNFSNTSNKIVNSIDTIAGRKGTQLSRPINMDGAWNASSFITLGLPLKGKLKGSNFNFNNNIRYNRDVNLINKNKNFTSTLAITQTVGINLDLKQKWNVGVNGSITYNNVHYSGQSNPNQDNQYYLHTYSADVAYMGLKNWVFSTDFDYFLNTGLAEGYNQAIPLWNSSIAHQFLKKKNGELKLSVYDMLNQNQSIRRTVGTNYIEDVRTLVLKRYFMLTFTYNLNKGSNPNQGRNMQVPAGAQRQVERMFRQ